MTTDVLAPGKLQALEAGHTSFSAAGAVADHFLKNDTEADKLRAKTARLRDARLRRDSVETEII